MVKVKLPKIKCKKCGYVFTPRKKEVFYCPRCKSAKWLVIIKK